jgi:hypothetical protein
MLTRRTKAKLAARAIKEMIEHPTMRRAATTVATPVVKRKVRAKSRRVRQRRADLGEAARSAGTTLAKHGPAAAETLGLYQPPKEKKAGPRVLVGIVIGATVMYLLEPDKGAARRGRLLALVGSPT